MATKTASKTGKRIDYLKALIDHPRTGEGEREAAKRALKRVLTAQETREDSRNGVISSWYRERVYGPKYQQGYMSAADIAKLIRTDIKLAMKAARAEAKDGEIAVPDPLTLIPADVKITVKTENFSGGRSIDVIMRNIPQDWGFSMQEPRWGGQPMEMPTPELRAAASALKDILDAYNHNGTMSEIDYFDVNYYGHVMTSGGLLLS